MVRTPSFKKWFGDWEKKAVANAILADKDISSDGKLLGMATTEQRKTAKALYDVIKDGEPIRTIDGRDIQFGARGFKETKQHSADPHTLALIEILPDVIRSMRFIGDGNNVDPEGSATKAYHLYARRVNLGDGSMIARIVIREDMNGNWFYDEESTSLKSIKGILNPEHRKPNPVKEGESPYAEKSIARFFDESQREERSKIVDGNGEPMVVYHGNLYGDTFTRFTTKHQWSDAPSGSFWFADDIDTSAPEECGQASSECGRHAAWAG